MIVSSELSNISNDPCVMSPSKIKNHAERLIAKAFTEDELQALFEKDEFRALIREMKSVGDAEYVVEIGVRILNNLTDARINDADHSESILRFREALADDFISGESTARNDK